MDVRVTLKPGQKGTRRLATRYGDRLVCVRYRYDKVKRKRYKTIELIVDEEAWIASLRMPPHQTPNTKRVGYVDQKFIKSINCLYMHKRGRILVGRLHVVPCG